jgi:hypothetical protein
MKRRRNSGRYILDGHQPVPCEDLFRWARWFETADRYVAKTRIGPLRVSTVFLGLDHAAFRGEAPLLFETMIFGTEARSEFSNSYCERYSTWEEAERGHMAAVELAQQQLAKAELLLKADETGGASWEGEKEK